MIFIVFVVNMIKMTTTKIMTTTGASDGKTPPLFLLFSSRLTSLEYSDETFFIMIIFLTTMTMMFMMVVVMIVMMIHDDVDDKEEDENSAKNISFLSLKIFLSLKPTNKSLLSTSILPQKWLHTHTLHISKELKSVSFSPNKKFPAHPQKNPRIDTTAHTICKNLKFVPFS